MQDLWVSLLRWKVFYQHNRTPLLMVSLNTIYRDKPKLVPLVLSPFGEPIIVWKGFPLAGGVSGEYTRGCKERVISV